MKLLMNSGDLTATQGGQPGTDPVEMRRLNYQTPAMVGHPPIPVGQLVAHVDALKANDNLRFSQEYEVGLFGHVSLDFPVWFRIVSLASFA